MLSAFEVSIQRNCKDEAAWKRERGKLYAEPVEVKRARKAAESAAGGPPGRRAPSMSAGNAAALLAQMNATDAMYGAR